MSDERLERLTDRQRECLRRVLTGFSAKETAEQLGISPNVVNEHLAAARRLLGVGRSIDAARLLHAAEGDGAAPYRLRGDPMGVGVPAAASDKLPNTRDREGFSHTLREMQVTYEADRAPPETDSWPLPIPRRRGDRNDLTFVQRLAWGLVLAFLAAALAGALVALQLTLKPPH